MQVTLKSLKGDIFQLSVEGSTTVKSLKNEIQDSKDIVVDKLIHQGKILQDEDTLASYDIADGALLIMMAKKAAPAAAPAAVPAPASAAAVAPVPAIVSQPAPSQPAALSPELEVTVQEMCSMGFPREQVLLAMRAAFNNAERAMQYLLDGIPDTTSLGVAQPLAHQDFDAGDDGDDGDDGDFGDLGGMSMDELRQSVPELEQALAAVRQQPELLQPLLAQLARTRPDIIQAINQNQGAFLQLLSQGAQADDGGDGDGDDGDLAPSQIQVTPQEHAAIRRLMDLGFPEAAVVEAYFTCDKDENMAANYLFENFGQ